MTFFLTLLSRRSDSHSMRQTLDDTGAMCLGLQEAVPQENYTAFLPLDIG